MKPFRKVYGRMRGNQAFTMAEMIITITIMVILFAAGFAGSQMLTDSADEIATARRTETAARTLFRTASKDDINAIMDSEIAVSLNDDIVTALKLGGETISYYVQSLSGRTARAQLLGESTPTYKALSSDKDKNSLTANTDISDDTKSKLNALFDLCKGGYAWILVCKQENGNWKLLKTFVYDSTEITATDVNGILKELAEKSTSSGGNTGGNNTGKTLDDIRNETQTVVSGGNTQPDTRSVTCKLEIENDAELAAVMTATLSNDFEFKTVTVNGEDVEGEAVEIPPNVEFTVTVVGMESNTTATRVIPCGWNPSSVKTTAVRDNYSDSNNSHYEYYATSGAWPDSEIAGMTQCWDDTTKTYTMRVVLDSLATGENLKEVVQFENLTSMKPLLSTSTWTTTTEPFTPGENIRVTVSAQAIDTANGNVFSLPGTENIKVCNSLYASRTEIKDNDGNNTGRYTVQITNARHLQNLNNDEKTYDSTNKTPSYDVELANNIEWKDINFTPINNPRIDTFTGTDANETTTGRIERKITGLKVDVTASGTESAGLFGTFSGSKIANITLINPSVTTGSGNAGALAGTLTADNVEITNCRAYLAPVPTDKMYDSENNKSRLGDYSNVKGGGNVGGLIGYATYSVTIDKSFAALVVRATGTDNEDSPIGNVGGLVGRNGSGNAMTVTNSYADCYLQGKNIGGLVGQCGAVNDTENSENNLSSKFINCYSAGFPLLPNGVTGVTAAGIAIDGSATAAATVTKCWSAFYFKDPTISENNTPASSYAFTKYNTNTTDSYYIGQDDTMSPVDVRATGAEHYAQYNYTTNKYGFIQMTGNGLPDGFPEVISKFTDETTTWDFPHYGDWREKAAPSATQDEEQNPDSQDGQ